MTEETPCRSCPEASGTYNRTHRLKTPQVCVKPTACPHSAHSNRNKDVRIQWSSLRCLRGWYLGQAPATLRAPISPHIWPLFYQLCHGPFVLQPSDHKYLRRAPWTRGSQGPTHRFALQPTQPQKHRTIERFGLEKTCEITESNRYPSPAKSTANPRPSEPKQLLPPPPSRRRAVYIW